MKVELKLSTLNDEFEKIFEISQRFSEKQIKAVLFVKENGKITNSDYQQLNKIGKTTATEELANLVNLGVLYSSTLKGRGSKYTIE